ncbi:hypothetical protein ACFE04_008122 [Oxalis oulophora]
MGYHRFLNSIPKISQKPKLYHTSLNPNSSLLLLHSNSNSSINNINNHLLKPIHYQIHTQISIGYPSNPQFSTYIHKTPNNIDNNNIENIQEISKEAERICKLVSQNPLNDSNIDSSLSKAKIDVSSPTLIVEVLKRLSNAGVVGLSFFRWAEKQNGFKHNADSYNTLIESLGKIKQFKLIWTLVDDMKRKRLLTKDTFALISRRYARARKVREAVDAFEKIGKYGFQIDLSDFNRLIDTLAKSKNVSSAQQVFDKMKNKRFKPDIKSFAILLEGWGQEQNLLRLDEVYREMKEVGFEPDVVTYGILINAYCKTKKYDDAIKMYHEMETKNIKPSPHIFCTLINGLGSDKRLDEALKFFELYKSNGFVAEAPTYNALVGAYCWSMRMNDVFRTVDEMRKSGVGPTSRTYDIILYHLVKARRTKQAYSVFQKMSEDCEPSVSTYEIIVRMFCKQDRVDMAMNVWDQMKAKGVSPGMHMFSILISSLSFENKLDEALKYFNEMLDIGIRPPAQLFSKLKDVLVEEGKENIVLDLAHKIDKLRKTPLVG